MSRFSEIVCGRAENVGLELSAGVVAGLEAYFALLARWNRRLNLTSLPVDTLGPEAIDRLLLEPLSAAAAFPHPARFWVDLGSGGGSPAIPLKLVRPEVELTMIEARGRKAAFLRELVRTLRLDAARVEAVRFETLVGTPAWTGNADVVTARAVRPDPAFVALVEQLLRSGGTLLLFESAGAEPLKSGALTGVGSRPLVGRSDVKLNIYCRE